MLKLKPDSNRFNPFEMCSEVDAVERIKRIVETAPPFGSPENLAQLEAARRDAERFLELARMPTDTLPH
jgi:hypothetical protein